MNWWSKYFTKVKYLITRSGKLITYDYDDDNDNVIDINSVSEIFLPMHRKAEDFSTGKLIITDLKGNPKNGNVKEKAVLKILLQGAKFLSYEQTLYQYIRYKNITGLSNIYFKKGVTISDYYILENEGLEVDYSINKSILTIDKYSDLIDKVTYNSNGKDQPLKKDQLLQIFDIGINHKTLKARSRFDYLSSDIVLAHRTKEALTGAMKRISMMIICDDTSDESMPVVSTGLIDDDQLEKQNNDLKNRYNLKKGGISYIPKKLKALDTNPDNGRLKGLETLEHEQRILCNALDVPFELFFANKSTFNNQEKVLQKYIADLEAEGSAFGSSISKFLGWENSTLKLDFSELKETISLQSNEQQENNVGTEI